MKKSLITIILALSILLAACGPKADEPAASSPVPAAVTVIVEGHAVPAQSLYLVFLARGRVDEVLVQRGDRVSAGDVLVRLGDRQQAEAVLTAALLELTFARQDYDTVLRTVDLGHAQAWQAYMNAQKTRAAAQLAWDRLDLNAIQTDIDNAQADVTARQADLEAAQTDFDDYKDLPADNATRKSYEDKLRTAQTNYDTAVQKLEDITNRRDAVRAALDAALASEAEAKRTYENTADGPDADKLALIQARLDNAVAQAAAAQSAVDNFELIAPFSGIVADVNIVVGQYVGPETWAVALADTSRWYVDTSDLSELDVVNVSVGQTVEVTADALPEVVMTGVVESISSAPKILGGDVLYTVHIRLTDPDPALRWGMTVEVTIKVED